MNREKADENEHQVHSTNEIRWKRIGKEATHGLRGIVRHVPGQHSQSEDESQQRALFIHQESLEHVQRRSLFIEVISCKDLIGTEETGKPDPFVKVRKKRKPVFTACWCFHST